MLLFSFTFSGLTTATGESDVNAVYFDENTVIRKFRITAPIKRVSYKIKKLIEYKTLTSKR